MEYYFQGWGMAITSDFAGGDMIRDENRNGISFNNLIHVFDWDGVAGDCFNQGSNSSDEEYKAAFDLLKTYKPVW